MNSLSDLLKYQLYEDELGAVAVDTGTNATATPMNTLGMGGVSLPSDESDTGTDAIPTNKKKKHTAKIRNKKDKNIKQLCGESLLDVDFNDNSVESFVDTIYNELITNDDAKRERTIIALLNYMLSEYKDTRFTHLPHHTRKANDVYIMFGRFSPGIKDDYFILLNNGIRYIVIPGRATSRISGIIAKRFVTNLRLNAGSKYLAERDGDAFYAFKVDANKDTSFMELFDKLFHDERIFYDRSQHKIPYFLY